ncbi:MAG: SGNH/GDSL hydrolase family protein [Nanoarchaeota archaeon]|nr:SGNH/GDSL hydrolase family protein [Nanoarchaeota archaeon]
MHKKAIKEYAINILLLFMTCALLLVLCEGIARLSMNGPPKTDRNLLVVSDNPVLGFKMQPNFSGAVLGKEVKTNSHGFRDYEFIRERNDAYRVIIIGDSLTFGYGVYANQSYPKILERLLQKSGRYEVFNLGVPGYNTVQEAELLERSVDYAPDLVVMSFYYNDFDSTLQGHNTQPGIYEYIFNADVFLYSKSRLYQYLKFNLRNNLLIASLFQRASTTKHYENLIKTQSREYMDMRGAIGKIKDISRLSGIPVVWLMLPQITNAKPYPLVYVYGHVEDVLREEGFKIVNMDEVVQDRNMSGFRLDTMYDAHPNERYYELAAENLYREIMNISE